MLLLNNSPEIIPDSDGNVTTTIVNNATIIFNFTNITPLIYHVLFYSEYSFAKVANADNDNYQYLGINNNQLYDINSTNNNNVFTINFTYDDNIKYVNIISIDETNMNKINFWTIQPGINFRLSAKINNLTYCVETVSWGNTINDQYFTIYRNNKITNYWILK